MWTKALATCAALMIAGPASAAAPGPIDPENGTISGFTYGPRAHNSYTSWNGGFPQLWIFSNEQIGYQGTPVAGRPFYLHARADLVTPHAATGNVLITIDQDAGGLPLRYTPSEGMPLKCTLTQFDPIVASADRACRSNVTTESGQFIVSNVEPLAPGLSFNVEVPVTVDSPTSGNAAMTAMWASDVALSNYNVVAVVPLTVAASPSPAPVIRKLPKSLRKYPKVKSLTPSVCKVAQRKVTVLRPGLCKLKGTKRGTSKVVKIRY